MTTPPPGAPPGWRKEQRARLIAARKTLTSEQREQAAAAVAARLTRIVAALRPRAIGVYWPIRNEMNLLPWARGLASETGIALCLPVVVTENAPLEYWRWTPGETMRPGVWNIPAPAQRDPKSPDLVLAPLVGFDHDRYRLGYGGGYFDRTLAASDPRPIAIGIGYDFSALLTIYPRPHDIPMHAILTEHRALLPKEWSDNAT